jgi:biofilm PGA synthesis protein PgaD
MATTGDDIHIEAPELLTGSERTRDTIATAAMWLFYLYLWVPLLSLVAWLLGLELAYDVMIRSGGARDLGGILVVYGVIVAIIFCAVTAWSLMNRYRFGHLARRRAMEPVSDEAMADYFGVGTRELPAMRAAKRIVVAFDDEGRLAISAD